MTDDRRKLTGRTKASMRELSGEDLEKVFGGVVSAEHIVIAPRDSVSGNATGRRAYH
jgi:hypothetical protein